jgi:dipeptidyl aminopeptidase/acylaminoacyl peptidase
MKSVLIRTSVVLAVFSVMAVKNNGVTVEYVVFAHEGHGFTKKKNQIEGYSAVLKFLDQHLKSKRATSF